MALATVRSLATKTRLRHGLRVAQVMMNMPFTAKNRKFGWRTWRGSNENLKQRVSLVPSPVVDDVEGAEIGIIAFGTTKYAIDEARDRLAADGVPTSFMRLRALPINDEVKAFVEKHDHVFVVELNRDGQLHKILQTEMPEMATKMTSLAFLDGMPLTARWVVDAINGAQK